MHRLEVIPMHCDHKARWRLQLSVNEGTIDDELCRYVRDLRFLPLLHLPLHGLEVPLHPVHTDAKTVLQWEVLRMLRQHWREVSVEHHVFADSDSQACGNGEPEGLVVTVANSDREAAAFKSHLSIQNSKHLHAIARHGVLVFEDADVSEAQGGLATDEL